MFISVVSQWPETLDVLHLAFCTQQMRVGFYPGASSEQAGVRPRLLIRDRFNHGAGEHSHASLWRSY